MNSILFGTSNSAPSISAVNYTSLNSVQANWNGTIGNRNQIAPMAMTISELYVQLGTAPGTGKSYTFTLYQNGSPTSLTVTISNSGTTQTDGTDSVSIAAGDILALQCSPSGTPSSSTNIWWNMQVATSSGFPVLSKNGTASPTTGTLYAPVMGGYNSSTGWNATEANITQVIPIAGTISNLYAAAIASPGSGSYVITVVHNGTTTATTTTLNSGNLTNEDTTHSFSVSAGDTISIQNVPTSTPSATLVGFSFQFTPTTDGQTWFGFGSSNTSSNSVTQFEYPLTYGNNGWNSTETARQMVPGPVILNSIYAMIDTAPNTGTRLVTMRQNAADTAVSASIVLTNTTGNTTGQSVTFAQGDLISVASEVSGTVVTDTGGIHFGVGYTVVSSAVNASVTQVAATVTVTGGTQSVATVQDISISQSAANVTAAGGTQSIAVINIVSLSQSAATVTANGGTQVVTTGSIVNASVSQVAATITATGGTQSVQSIQNASVSQSAATVTATGGTQVVLSVNVVAVSQSHATLTATGGTQSVQSIQTTSSTQSAATVTATGGTQVVATVNDVAISQSAATVTAHGGTPTVLGITVVSATVSQSHATLTATGGTQVPFVSHSSSVTQLVASIIASGGSQHIATSRKNDWVNRPVSGTLAAAVNIGVDSDIHVGTSVGSNNRPMIGL